MGLHCGLGTIAQVAHIVVPVEATTHTINLTRHSPTYITLQILRLPEIPCTPPHCLMHNIGVMPTIHLALDPHQEIAMSYDHDRSFSQNKYLSLNYRPTEMFNIESLKVKA